MNTQAKLEKKLKNALAPLIHADPEVITFNLTPARGRWTHRSQDVMQFKGSILVNGALAFSIGSWESMSKCLRHGFTITDERKSSRRYAQFIVEASIDTSTDWYSSVQLEEIASQQHIHLPSTTEYRSKLGKTIKKN